MRPPIVVVDGETVDLFDSVARAERYLEPPDVKGLLIFDADGLRLRADVVEDDVRVFFSMTTKRPRVVIHATDPPIVERQRLEDLVRTCIQANATEVPPERDVIATAIRIFGYTA